MKNELATELRMEIPLTLVSALIDVCKYPTNMIEDMEIIPEHKLSSHSEEADLIFRYRT